MEEDSFNNWDLQAVVRGHRLSPPPADPFSFCPPPSQLLLPQAPMVKQEELEETQWCFPNLMESPSGLHELEEFCKAFYARSTKGGPHQVSLFPADVRRGGGDGAGEGPAPVVGPFSQPQPLEQQQRKPNRPLSQTPRSKRRKNQQKRVICQVPADGVSSDMWAWRKYGQKPIKGSPYPRGYYRCSSSKGCLARKQVERSRTDPNMFIITYTAEHNHPVPTHRNSLAGSTRQKFPTPATSVAGSGGDGLPAAAGLSPTTPLTASMEEDLLQKKGEEYDEEEEEEGVLLVEDVEMVGEDEFLLMGSEETSSGKDGGEKFSSLFEEIDGGLGEPYFNPPWMVGCGNNNTAAATGGS